MTLYDELKDFSQVGFRDIYKKFIYIHCRELLDEMMPGELDDSITGVVAQNKVNQTLRDLQKKFQYYRLSLYIFSLASMTEIMLSGNYKEENISNALGEIRKYSDEYRELFSGCSVFLEKMTSGSVETNALKGIGFASDKIGKAIGRIPKIKDGQIDEFLQGSGEKLRNNAEDISRDVVSSFAKVSDPNTRVFMEKMEDMIKIYDKTEEICFDKNNIYLISG